MVVEENNELRGGSTDNGNNQLFKRVSSHLTEQKIRNFLTTHRSTGFPKEVEISHYNVVANATQILYKRAIVSSDQKGKDRKARLDVSGERWLAPLPMYHAYVSIPESFRILEMTGYTSHQGQAYYCANAACIGSKVFIMKSFNVQKYLLYLDI